MNRGAVRSVSSWPAGIGPAFFSRVCVNRSRKQTVVMPIRRSTPAGIGCRPAHARTHRAAPCAPAPGTRRAPAFRVRASTVGSSTTSWEPAAPDDFDHFRMFEYHESTLRCNEFEPSACPCRVERRRCPECRGVHDGSAPDPATLVVRRGAAGWQGLQLGGGQSGRRRARRVSKRGYSVPCGALATGCPLPLPASEVSSSVCSSAESLLTACATSGRASARACGTLMRS